MLKRCACGVSIRSREAWRALRLVGVQDLGEGERAELRNCSCGSTLMVEIPSPALLADLAAVFATEAAEAARDSERGHLLGAAKDLASAAMAAASLQTCATRPPRAA